MSTPLTDYDYVILQEISFSVWGKGTLLWKRDTEEIWFQRIDGSLVLIAPTAGNEFYFQVDPPASPGIGAQWIHADTGIFYVYVNDGVSSQWMQPY